MVSIVNSLTTLPNCETPPPANDAKVQISDGSGVYDKVFAEKSKDFKETITEIQEKSSEEEEKKDNGKGSNSTAEQCAVYGIAGILEGFGSLSYQSDGPVKNESAQIICAEPQTAQTLTVIAQTDAEAQNGLAEQIAWMLQTKDAGAAPAQTQYEILKTIGGYLDSLENVSEVPKEDIILKTEGDAEKSVMAINTQNENKDSKVNVTDVKQTFTADAETEERKGVQEEIRIRTENGNASPREKSAGAEAVSETESAIKQSPNAISGDKLSVKEEERSFSEVKGAEAETGKTEHADNKDDSANMAITAHTEKPLSERTAEKAADLPADVQSMRESMKENVLRIVDNVSTRASEGEYQFDVELKPEFLGKVSIRLVMKEDGLKVLINAEDDSVKAMLADQTSSLHSLLKDKGVTVINIEVTSDSRGMQDSNGQAFRRHESGDNPGTGHYYEPPAGEEEQFGAVMEQYGVFSGNTGREFFA